MASREKTEAFRDFTGDEIFRLIYFRELLIVVNLSLRFEPRPFTTATIAIEIPAAISPYSMAVAPESSPPKSQG